MNKDYLKQLADAVYGGEGEYRWRIAEDPVAKDAANLIVRHRARITELEAENERLREAMSLAHLYMDDEQETALRVIEEALE